MGPVSNKQMEHKKTISNNNNNNNYVVNIISTNDNTNVINTISSNDDNNNNNNNDNNNIVVLWPIRKTVFVFKKNFSFLDQVQKCFASFLSDVKIINTVRPRTTTKKQFR